MSVELPASLPTGMPTEPRMDLVQTLMRECDCTQERAINLLQTNNNDIARAKRHYNLYAKYIKSANASRSTTPVPEQAQQPLPPSRRPSSPPSPPVRYHGDYQSRVSSPSHSTSPSNASVFTPQSENESGALLSPPIVSRPPTRRPVPNHFQPPSPVSINFIPADSTSIPPEDSSLTPFNSSVNADQNNQQSPEFADNLTLNIHHDGDTGPADGSEDAVMEDVNLQRPEWDFSLPELPFPGDLVPGVGDENGDFSAERLAAAMQHRIAVDAARTYMNSYDIGTVQRLINDEVDGFPVIFYAVAANDERMVRLLLESGADASSIHDGTRTPLLGFAIICGETLQQDTTSIVSLLLSYGASPHVVPQELISPYDKDLAAVSKSDGDGGEVTKETAWCTKTARMKLAKATNITHRYYLDRAAKMKKPSRKRRQVAQLRNAERLLGVPYFLIGQPIASDLLIQRLLAYLIRPTSHPLVLCFAGPSGHGKTELARQLGQLLSLDLEVVDCTVVNREIELFGPRDPYVGAEKGSPVNNFLAEHNGKRCIVFFDEFEKTTKEIHQSLLLPFDNGEYRDRRNHDKVDCSKTIFIMATNALDEIILNFCTENEAINGDDVKERSYLAKKLSGELRDEFLQHFKAPVTGRVSEFVPFLPFSPGEQAVITHKSLLELTQDLRRPVNLTRGSQEQLVGNIRLTIRKDATVCGLLAQANYHKQLGARSLKAGAKKVEHIVLDAYLDEDEEIKDDGIVREFVVDVHGGEIVGYMGKETK